MKNSFFYIFIFLFAINFCKLSTANAQTGIVRGFVYDKETGEAVIFTNVYLLGTTYGVSTDVNGFYSITKIPPGDYVLTSTSIGYDTVSYSLSLTADQIFTKKLFLSKRAVQLEEIDISANKQEAKTEIQISITKITPKDIKQIPSIGGEPDLAQYLQVLPGVIFTGDQGGQLYIRGGAPIQNKIILDGMVVYNPFHSIGLFSVFDTDIIRNVDVYTGGYNAEYGGRISAVMDVVTRDGNKKKLSGKASVTPFTSKVLVEGPLAKYQDGKGSSSFILSAKNSYLDRSSKVFYSYVDSAGLPYSFTDLYGKTSFTGANGSKINLFGFNFSDKVDYSGSAELKWNAIGAGTNFVIIPATTAVLIQGNFAYSGYDITMNESDNKPRFSKINGFNSGLNFVYFIKQDELKYGMEILGFETDFEFYNTVGQRYRQNDFTTEIAGFVKYKKIIRKLLLEPSFRVHYYPSLDGNISLEPRLGSKFNLTDNLRLKVAGGFYSQNLMSASSDRDVVNLFTGFLSGPQELPETFDGKEVTSKLQKARHLVSGIEYDLGKYLELNVEPYFKYFNQLTNINRNKILEDNEDNFNEPDYLKKDFIIESGKSYGIDILIKYDYKRWYFWTGYSLAYVNRFDEVRTYNPHYDRRHNLNLLASCIWGKDLNWEFSSRWSLGSGFPFTKIQGYYPYVDFSSGVSTDYTTINEQLNTQYDELNKGRLPYYHRLDLSIKHNFDVGKYSIMEVIASVSNAYNRNNIFYLDPIYDKEIYQLPILPSLGINMTF